MVKMLAGNFPPRRPAGFVRYGLAAIVILMLLYSFSGSTPSVSRPGSFSRPAADDSAKSLFGDPDIHPAPGGPPPDDSKLDPVAEPSDPLLSSGGSSGSGIDSTYTDDPTDTMDGPLIAGQAPPKRPQRPKKPEQDAGKSKTHKPGSFKPDPSKPGPVDPEDPLQPQIAKKPGEVQRPSSGEKRPTWNDKKPSAGDINNRPTSRHPIDKLIYDSERTFAALVDKETKTLEQAAQAYRKRRGRHPPPGFDKWFEFAQEKNSLIIEDFFDQVYHDLDPFWGADPRLMRKEASRFEMTINIRNGNASAGSDWFWTQIWLNMTKGIEHLLPDMDLALNAMDEPRLVVPWEDVDAHMKRAAKTLGLPKAKSVISEFQTLPPPGKVEPDIQVQIKTWEDTKPYWPVARRGCPPDSLARRTPLQKSFADTPVIVDANAAPHMYEGYVSNYTLSTDVCHQPDLQGLEGILIRPLSMSACDKLFPMFGGSKLTVGNEILLPAPMYWSEEERFTGGDDHGISWRDKEDRAIWRGVATGGFNNADNWRGFQRHRFVAMNNGSKLVGIEDGEEMAENFAMPSSTYGLSAQSQGHGGLGKWVASITDVAFTELMCAPPDKDDKEDVLLDEMHDGPCRYDDYYFDVLPGYPMAEQFDNKFLPDLDGNSFSGRYLGFLRSTSVPVKATIWREWHDSRLVAWKHFVPMDNRYSDWYGLMEYFLGFDGRNDHDRAAERIATEGKEWAEKVLRKEDMQIYVLRLLLEYARVMDDNREQMGWVDDVLANPSLERTWTWWW